MDNPEGARAAAAETRGPHYARAFMSFRFAPHQLIAGHIPKGARVLDVGCGEGALALELKARGCEVVALELEPHLFAEASRRGLDVRKFDVTRDPLESLGSFDVVICADVLEHLTDPWTALRRLRTLLRPGALLLVSIPNVAFLSVRLALMMGRFEYQSEGLLDETHLRFFTHASSRRLLEDCGFAIRSEAITLPVPSGALPMMAPRIRRLMERPRLGRALYNAASICPGLFGYQFVYAAHANGAPAG